MIDQIATGPTVDPAVSVRLSSATQACYSPRGAAGAAYAFTADVRADPPADLCHLAAATDSGRLCHSPGDL